MNKYKVKVPFSGYSRGYVVIDVEADSEEDAKNNAWDGIEFEKITVRDDAEYEWREATIVDDKNAS